MADQLAKAEDFEKKAEKKLNGWGLFCSKYEDDSDLFDKAANSFKLAKSWKGLERHMMGTSHLQVLLKILEEGIMVLILLLWKVEHVLNDRLLHIINVDIHEVKSSVLHLQPKSTVGTPAYIALEVLLRQEYDGKVDYFGYMVLLKEEKIVNYIW